MSWLDESLKRIHAEMDEEAAAKEQALRAAEERRAAVDADPILRSLRDNATLCGLILAALRLRPGMSIGELHSLTHCVGSVLRGPEPEEVDRALIHTLLGTMEQVGWVDARVDPRLRRGAGLAYFAK